jgi:hypothetical protein
VVSARAVIAHGFGRPGTQKHRTGIDHLIEPGHRLPIEDAAFDVILLLDVLVFWFGPMCFLNLICFDYAKQMRDAPDKAD